MPQYLFSTDADDVTITRAGSGFQVSLDAQNQVMRFTDRPYRKASTMSLRTLARNWKAYGFAQDPPNAALLLEKGSETRTSVVEMTRPRIAGGRVSFRLKQITQSFSVGGYRHRHALRASTYDHAALFIDNASVISATGTFTLDPGNSASFDLPTGQKYQVLECATSGSGRVQWNGGNYETPGCWDSRFANATAATINGMTVGVVRFPGESGSVTFQISRK